MDVARFDYDRATRLMARIDGIWTDVDDQKPDAITYDDGASRALARGPDGRIYRFVDLVAGGAALFVYDGNTWERIPGTISSVPFALAIAPNNDIYIGGFFTTIDGNPFVRAAYYDVSAEAWTAMENGFNNTVLAMQFHPNGDLYIGGSFTSDGGGGGKNWKGVARWDGSSLHAIGGDPSGVDDTVAIPSVQDIAISADGSYIYLGGVFDINGDGSQSLGNIARYVVSTDTIEPMGNSSNPGFSSLNYVNSLAIAPDNSLYMAGAMATLATGEAVSKIVRWNGSSFASVGELSDWPSSEVEVIAIDPNTGFVYAEAKNFRAPVGSFAVDLDEVALAIWNGSVWTRIDLAINTDPARLFNITDILITPDSDIYAMFDAELDEGINYSSAALTSVNNPGTAPCPLRLVIEGGEGQLNWLENLTTGQRVFFDYFLAEGEILTIDTGAGTVVSNLFGKVLRAVLKNSDFGAFELLPGDNQLLLFVEKAFEVTAVGSLVPRHWSIDVLGL